MKEGKEPGKFGLIVINIENWMFSRDHPAPVIRLAGFQISPRSIFRILVSKGCSAGYVIQIAILNPR